MVQFNLPQNSKIEVGKHYKDTTNSNNLRKVNVYRWDPSTGHNPRVIHLKLTWVTVDQKF